jgi:uncharacterized protein
MKIFLDTSSLFKLYHKEVDTEVLEQVFTKEKITSVFLSEISKIEFTSTVWKKVRMKDITEIEAKATLELFELDFEKYTFIPVDSFIVEQARLLTSKYGKQGLRTLDGIQLSTSVTLFEEVNIFFTSDILLKTLFIAEGLPIEMPSS